MTPQCALNDRNEENRCQMREAPNYRNAEKGNPLRLLGALDYVRMCVCVYECMGVRMCMCMHVRMHIHMHLCLYVRVHVCMRRARVYMHVRMHMLARVTHACMYVRMHVCMYVCVHACMDACRCVYVCMYVCMYVCVSECVRMHVGACMYLCVHACVCVRAFLRARVVGLWQGCLLSLFIHPLGVSQNVLPPGCISA